MREVNDIPVEITIDADKANDLALLKNTPAQVEYLLHSLEQSTIGIGLCMKSNKTGSICFKWNNAIPTINGQLLRSVD